MSFKVTVTGPHGRVTGTADTEAGARLAAMAAYKKKHGPWTKGTLTCGKPRAQNPGAAKPKAKAKAAPKAAPRAPAAPKAQAKRQPNPARAVRVLQNDGKRAGDAGELRYGARGQVMTVATRDGRVDDVRVHDNQTAAEEWAKKRREGEVLVARLMFYGVSDG